MNFALVDDLKYDLDNLQKLLLEYFSLTKREPEISLFFSGEAFLSAFFPGRFDAVFLDNLMDGLSGMETARRLRELYPSVPIIFITTEESFALEATRCRPWIIL